MIKVFLLRWLGNFLLLSSLAGAVLTLWPVIREEVKFRYYQTKGIEFVVQDTAPPTVNLLNISPHQLPLTPISTDFSIVIPKIAANAKIIDNVDAGDYAAYSKALRQGVAHAAGTAYPGETGNVYLFAHSGGNFWEISRWNAVFYLLKELNPGDEVNVFYRGKRYLYQVYDKKIVEPTDTQYLSTVANFPMLTLQTCWPPGTTLKRLLVFARLTAG